MTSFEELIGTHPVPVTERASRASVASVVLEWLRSFGAAAAQVVLTIAVLLGLLATVPVAFGQISTTVMSDSMEPGLHSGDVVILRPVATNRVKVGQVVLVDDPDTRGRLRLHRLVDVRKGDLVLKGDANAAPDSDLISKNAVHGVGWLRVPWIGLPVLWMRQHTYLPLVAAGVALMLLAWLAASDRPEDGRHRDEPTLARRGARRVLQRLGRLRRRLRRSKALQSGGVTLLLAGMLVAAPLHDPGAAAVFNSTTNAANSLATGTFDCPTRPYPSAYVLYYSFMSVSGTAEPDVSGTTPTLPGTLGSGVTRSTGTCQTNSSPYVDVDGTANGYFAANSSEASRNTNMGISLWFKTTTNTGVLASFGATNTAATGAGGDRQIYFNGGKLAVAMGRTGNPIAGCTITTAPSLNTWHLAVFSFDSGKNINLYLDNNAQSCSATNNSFTSLASGYWRFGGDLPLDSGASNNYAGSLDETAVYNAALASSAVTTIFNAGH